ncbi:glycosyltransferase family 2 protein [uncultured Jatrophihabitans sp.]|uniref:glycosyltransferase family 2 protein n=1 Tax=uncultured Jatrophihabitans sp. TaxID=1610747 RepID=UPI0035CB09BB
MIQRPSLTVVVPTYRRPTALHRCLNGVLEHTRAAQTDGLADVAPVLVIDNDPDGGARSAVEIYGAEVRYVHEPVPGIAAVRARALREVTTRLLSFIDDDEVPCAGWLPELLATWEQSRPAAVVGRVISVYDGDVHPWLTTADLFGRVRKPTGTLVPQAAAGNLLLDADWVHGHQLTFDLRLGLGGGEDNLFSRALVAAGGDIVWCDESVAEDHVPADRATLRWLMKRVFSQGHASVAVDLLAAHGDAAAAGRIRLRAVVAGVGRILVGAPRLVAGVLARSDHRSGLAVRLVVRGAGMVWAGFGVTHHEYARVARVGVR